jgi:hypothetical protein
MAPLIEQANHLFKDPGEPIDEADYQPKRLWSGVSPEQQLSAAFIKMGRDYGGPLPVDFVLHAVLQGSGPPEKNAAN